MMATTKAARAMSGCSNICGSPKLLSALKFSGLQCNPFRIASRYSHVFLNACSNRIDLYGGCIGVLQ